MLGLSFSGKIQDIAMKNILFVTHLSSRETDTALLAFFALRNKKQTKHNKSTRQNVRNTFFYCDKVSINC